MESAKVLGTWHSMVISAHQQSHQLGMLYWSWPFSAFQGSVPCKVLYSSNTQTVRGNRDSVDVIHPFPEGLE